MSFWTSISFKNIPLDELHKCYTILRDAKINAYEFPDFGVVLAETRYVGDPEDPGVGDIVPMTEILMRRLNSLGGKIIFHMTRLTDKDIEKLEALYAAPRKGPVDFDQIYEEIRSEEGQERLLRDGEQPSEVREGGG